MWVGPASRPNSDPVRLLLATRNPSWRCLGQAEQALSFAIAALRGKRKWSKALYLEGTNNKTSSGSVHQLLVCSTTSFQISSFDVYLLHKMVVLSFR